MQEVSSSILLRSTATNDCVVAPGSVVKLGSHLACTQELRVRFPPVSTLPRKNQWRFTSLVWRRRRVRSPLGAPSRSSSPGRASASQAEGNGFESRDRLRPNARWDYIGSTPLSAAKAPHGAALWRMPFGGMSHHPLSAVCRRDPTVGCQPSKLIAAGSIPVSGSGPRMLRWDYIAIRV